MGEAESARRSPRRRRRPPTEWIVAGDLGGESAVPRIVNLEKEQMADSSHQHARPLDGRHALITGGSRGIGRAIAVGLARAGANISFSYRARADEARETAAAIEACGRRASVIQADVTSRDDIAR